MRTGDEGYLDHDGHLRLTGRLKEIINRGSEKISPREVDEVLLGHPAIADAATFAVAHDKLGEEVAAAIVLKPGASLSRREVIDYPRMVGAEVAERQPCPYRRREMAEMIWLTLHDNALRFLESVPETRQRRVSFEDLGRAPQGVMRELSAFPGLDYEPGMIAPHDDRAGRMTDGIHPVSRMIGDMKFHQHRRIEAGVAELWKTAFTARSTPRR